MCLPKRCISLKLLIGQSASIVLEVKETKCKAAVHADKPDKVFIVYHTRANGFRIDVHSYTSFAIFL